MRYENISCYAKINEIEETKVLQIMESMKKDGYKGCPILIYGESLLTGSHRLEALDRLETQGFEVNDWEVATDVTEIVESKMKEFEEENGYLPDIDYSNIGWLLKGSWVEEFKNEIEEW